MSLTIILPTYRTLPGHITIVLTDYTRSETAVEEPEPIMDYLLAPFSDLPFSVFSFHVDLVIGDLFDPLVNE
jgi:hypothetical protein